MRLYTSLTVHSLNIYFHIWYLYWIFPQIVLRINVWRNISTFGWILLVFCLKIFDTKVGHYFLPSYQLLIYQKCYQPKCWVFYLFVLCLSRMVSILPSLQVFCIQWIITFVLMISICLINSTKISQICRSKGADNWIQFSSVLYGRDRVFAGVFRLVSKWTDT